MAMTLEINATAPETMEVKLVGTFYDVTPPKTALSMNMIGDMDKMKKEPKRVLKAVNSWIDSAFTEKDAKKVRDRLNDPRDLLDIDHISEMVKALMEAKTENPTTSGSD